MTPMIDIVFLLIIFFMTVSQVSEVNRERLELPQQQGSQDQKPAVLTININELGEILVGGSRLSVIGPDCLGGRRTGTPRAMTPRV